MEYLSKKLQEMLPYSSFQSILNCDLNIKFNSISFCSYAGHAFAIPCDYKLISHKAQLESL